MRAICARRRYIWPSSAMTLFASRSVRCSAVFWAFLASLSQPQAAFTRDRMSFQGTIRSHRDFLSSRDDLPDLVASFALPACELEVAARDTFHRRLTQVSARAECRDMSQRAGN